MAPIVDVIISLLNLINLLLIVRIVLSWFPGINWNAGFFRILDSITEPILTPFRRLIPPIGGMLDISPIVPLFLINIIVGFLSGYGSNPYSF
ncbi:MAG: YggT family protein [Vampirovibrionia bacterium]